MLDTVFIHAANPSVEKRHYYAVIELSGNGLTFEIRDSENIKIAPDRDDKDRRRKEPFRLSEQIQAQGYIDDDTTLKLLHILKRERASINELIADGHDVTVRFVGTAPARDPACGPYLQKVIKDETGLDMTAISGDEEARLAASGLLEFYPNASGLVIDMGGGTTEFALIENGKIIKTQSIPIGTSSIKRPKNVKKAMEMLDPAFFEAEQVFCIGGTFRNINKAFAKGRLLDIKGRALQTCKPKEYKKFIDKLTQLGDKEWLEMHESLQLRRDFVPIANIFFNVLKGKMTNLKSMGLVKTKTRDGVFVDIRSRHLRWSHDVQFTMRKSSETAIDLCTP